jgi:hypothetical protein
MKGFEMLVIFRHTFPAHNLELVHVACDPTLEMQPLSSVFHRASSVFLTFRRQ